MSEPHDPEYAFGSDLCVACGEFHIPTPQPAPEPLPYWQRPAEGDGLPPDPERRAVALEYLAQHPEPREYRKVATVMAYPAETGGIIPTREGDHTYEAGDYICGPGQAGEFWPVKRSIFEATYIAVAPKPPAEADAAWEALVADLPEDVVGSVAAAVARHRPRIEAALAQPLDVDVLAHALHMLHVPGWFNGHRSSDVDLANDIAREYAAILARRTGAGS